jgi:ABC-type multidrug transport system fused ATPase/permease subunit
MSTAYFSHITKKEYDVRALLVLGVVFTFLINLFTMFFVWIRGHAQVFWTLDAGSSLNNVAFVVKYMFISLIGTVGLPWLVNLALTFKTPEFQKFLAMLEEEENLENSENDKNVPAES